MNTNLATHSIQNHAGNHQLLKTIVKPELVLQSGIAELDSLIGGFKAGEITLIDGDSNLITDTPNQLCVTTYRTFQSNTIYIDGGMCANPYKIARYARMMELDQRETLKHVWIGRAFTVYQLSTLVHDRIEALIKQHTPRTLIIGMFPALYHDPDVPPHEAVTLLNHALMKLRDLTVTHQLITILTHLTTRSASLRRRIHTTLYSSVDEIVRMHQGEQCISVNLVKQNRGTTIVRFARGQLRLDAFGMVM